MLIYLFAMQMVSLIKSLLDIHELMVLVHRLVVGKLWQPFPWFGLDRLAVHCVTGSDNSLQGDESVQLGIAIAVLYSVM